MQHFAYSELKHLIENNNKPAISIFLPTHPVSKSDRRDQIELKNGLKQAEILLEEHDLSGANTPELLQPARELLDDAYFWQHQNKGLAIYLAPGFSRIYRLPIAFKQEVIVNSRFQITPLLPFFEGQQSFYILALSLNQIKIFEASEYEIEAVSTDQLPQDLQALFKDGVFETQLQGKNDLGQDKKEQIHQYCQAINKGLSGFLKKTKAPLVVASVDELYAIFKQHCDYPGLIASALSGNPEDLSEAELLKQGLRQVMPVLKKEKQAALASVEALQTAHKLLCHTDQVLQAAYNSRVEKLFLIQNNHTKGIINEAGRVLRHAPVDPDDQDLVNLAAIHTLLNGGEVYTIAAGCIKNANEVAALLRY